MWSKEARAQRNTTIITNNMEWNINKDKDQTETPLGDIDTAVPHNFFGIQKQIWKTGNKWNKRNKNILPDTESRMTILYSLLRLNWSGIKM